MEVAVIMRILPIKATKYKTKNREAHKISSSGLAENPMRRNPFIVVKLAIILLIFQEVCWFKSRWKPIEIKLLFDNLIHLISEVKASLVHHCKCDIALYSNNYVEQF